MQIENLWQLLHYPLTSNEIEAGELYKKRIGLWWVPLERGSGLFFIGFHVGTTTPDFNPWRAKECLDYLKCLERKLNLGRLLS